jgi:hypothetical protein
MNFVPAVVFILFRKKLQFDQGEISIWHYFALASLIMPVLLFLVQSVHCHRPHGALPNSLANCCAAEGAVSFQGRGFGRALIVGYAAAVLFTWLNFAAHAKYWVPYHIYPGLFD